MVLCRSYGALPFFIAVSTDISPLQSFKHPDALPLRNIIGILPVSDFDIPALECLLRLSKRWERELENGDRRLSYVMTRQELRSASD